MGHADAFACAVTRCLGYSSDGDRVHRWREALIMRMFASVEYPCTSCDDDLMDLKFVKCAL